MQAASGAAATPVTTPARTLLLFATWFALLTGLGQLCAWILALALDLAVHVDPQLVWMTSAANLAVFLVFALVLLPLYRGTQARWTPALAVFVVACTLTLLLMVPRIHRFALLVLALGMGVQTGRWLAARHAQFERWVRRTLPAMAGLVVLLALIVNVRMYWREWQAARAVPPVSGSPPNLLFIIWDTVRAENLGLYGYTRDTSPNLTALSARGVVFERAISPAPWTLAAHGSFFTGRQPWELSASWEVPLDDTYPTLAETLSANGYATAAFIANYIYGPPAYGLGRGFARYRFYPVTLGYVLTRSTLVEWLVPRLNRTLGTYWNPDRRHARQISDTFLQWQQGVEDRPFFAFLNYFDAHDPYVPESPFDTMFGNPRVRRVGTGEQLSPGAREELIAAYDGGIAAVDHELGRVLDALQRRGVLDNTLLIVASDHGELLGEQRLYGHGNSLYYRELHVPLLIAMPGRVPTGVRVSQPVSLRDLPATIAQLLELPDTTFPGTSLARHWTGEIVEPSPVFAVVPFSPRQPEWFPISAGDMRAVFDWPWHYIVKGNGEAQLFDLEEDPAEAQDRIGQADSATVERLRALIEQVPPIVTRSR